MAHILPERPCQPQATVSAWWADVDAKYILTSLLSREYPTHPSAKWVNAKDGGRGM